MATKKKTSYKKKKVKKKRILARADVFVQATYNNTIVTLADTKGDVIAWSSAGRVGFKGPKKSTPYAAMQVVRDVLEQVKDSGIKEVDVYLKGVGSGRESAVRAFGSQNINILSIKDMTPTPHNGCRSRRPRRV